MRGADCWTDHHMILMKVRIQVRPLRHQCGLKNRPLRCTRLSNSDTRKNFCRFLADKLGKIEQLISSEAGMDEKWSSLSSTLFNAAAESIGFQTQRQQDWFDKNNREISNPLDKMHKAHRTTLNNPTSQPLRNQWQAFHSEAQATLRNL